MQQDLCVMEMEGTEVTERTPHNIYKQNLPGPQHPPADCVSRFGNKALGM